MEVKVGSWKFRPFAASKEPLTTPGQNPLLERAVSVILFPLWMGQLCAQSHTSLRVVTQVPIF